MTTWLGVFEGAGSGFRFSEGEGIEIEAPTRTGSTARIRISSRYESVGGGDLYPVALRVTVLGEASSSEDVQDRFWHAAVVLLPPIAVGVNASFPELEMVAAVEISEREENEILHRAGSDDPLVIREMKKTPPGELLLEAVQATMSGPDSDWVHRAALQYAEGLHYWRAGSELMVVEHLFMAAEVVSQVVVRRHCAATGLRRAQLAEAWGLDKVQELEASIRARCVFGDRTLAKDVRKVSDGLEHGYRSFPQLQSDAARVRDIAAVKVREAILNLLSLGSATQDVLSKGPFDTPARAERIGVALGGKLLGDTTAMADADFIPALVSNEASFHFEQMDPDKYRLKTSGRSTVNLPPGLSFKPERIGVSGPVESLNGATLE